MYSELFSKLRKLIIPFSAVLCLMSVISCGPSGTVKVKVKVSYADYNSGNQLEYVRVTSGGDKTELYTIPAGATENTKLWPGATSQPQLFLSYDFKGKRRYWEGPKMPRGKGYKIEVVIGSNGKVIEHKISQ